MEKPLGTVAFIPVRGGSKSIPLKNIKPFCGKPLVYWTVAAAAECEEIDCVYVATDDNQIREAVESFGLSKVVVIGRSAESAHDTASTEIALLEFAENTNADRIILVQATSPLLESKDLQGALHKLAQSQADSLVSVVRQKRFIWSEESGHAAPINYDPNQRPRRQDWDGYFVENGAFYITGRENLLASQCRISGDITVYEMPEVSYFELDEPSDWIICEQLKAKQLSAGVSKQLKSTEDIKLLVSDVDGVLTDAGMYYSTDGQELKKFNTRDGKGIELLKLSGIKVMLLTAEDIEVVRARGLKLKVDYLYMGIKDKKAFLNQFFRDNPEFSFQSTAYIGDDVNDLECLLESAISASPKDAHPDVRARVSYVCELGGGQGCVRELCDLLLKTKQVSV
ncbi:N-acylneuraminate cytidylyltransferase [Paenibacillus sp. OV219]|uniref:N-acylneuraminate cytidylyltransferase n=1 Tax=Paenibacillus sp. OV219 TaxID=1884377 RepID=UPI0008D5EBBB|nr:N-acylneuraminate cytidylyltransferase [Paenibacillus sp. OV219]SEN65776.1 N-acylneuraminate cytidylyltransferase [Paenibacillus sp. OV219]